MNEPDVLDMLHDKREIHALVGLTDGNDLFCTSSTGPAGCEKIVAYAENGHMAPIPFLAVYKRGQIFARIPATAVMVIYR